MDADDVHSGVVGGVTAAGAQAARRIIVADDDDLVRMGLGLLLRAVDPDIVLDEAADGARLAALLQDGTPRYMLLVDLDMPGFDGEAGVVRILATFPDLPVVVISGAGDPGIMRRLLEAGVRGFLPKSTEGPLMRKAIELVMAGGRFVPPDALAADVVRPDPPAPATPVASGVSPRQQDVLELLMQGLPNKLIAARLDIAEATVKMHVTALLRAHGAQSRAELIAGRGRARGQSD